jgi:hypothetical protein
MSNKTLVQLYSHITIWATIYGLLAAHVPAIIGHPWTSCDNCGSKLGCILLIHLFEAPLALFNLYVAWYGLKRYSTTKPSLYISLLGTVLTVNLVFFCFECLFIYTNLRSFAPAWENILLATVALMLIGSCTLAIYVKQKLIETT